MLGEFAWGLPPRVTDFGMANLDHIRNAGARTDQPLRQTLSLQFDRRLPKGYRHWKWVLLCTGAVLAYAGPARAQTTSNAYFPVGISGYDQDLGVTVLSRIRSGYQEQGAQLGSFTVRPDLDQSIFDNSNVNGTSGSGGGSWGSDTAASISGGSNWDRNSLNASIGVDHTQFFALPSESYTNWNIGLGGGYTIGDSELAASYSHSSYNQLGTTIGFQRSSIPALNTTDTGELSYTFNFGRFAVTPTLDLSAYRFGPITAGGFQVSQTNLNRNVIAGGVVTRYELTGATGLLFVARGTSSDYIDQQPGQVSNNSSSVLVLAGLDYQSEAIWRYSLLVGVENTDFSASQYGTYTAPIVSADVVYTPTGVLTVTGSATRSIQDTDTTGNSGFVLSQANLVLDYELLRNVLLEGRAGFQNADYIQGGSQNNETVGGGVTWLVNQNVRLSVNDDYTNQASPGSTEGSFNGEGITSLSGAYTQNILLLSLHLGL